MQNNCIFCKIIAGDIPSATIYEDEEFKVIMDISPAAKGHAIILSKKHYANLFELEDVAAAKVLIVARKVGNAIMEEFKCDGLNVLQNNGEAAGQTVFHYHIHLIPRYHEDKVTVDWLKESYADGEAQKVAEAIAKRINKKIRNIEP